MRAARDELVEGRQRDVERHTDEGAERLQGHPVRPVAIPLAARTGSPYHDGGSKDGGSAGLNS